MSKENDQLERELRAALNKARRESRLPAKGSRKLAADDAGAAIDFVSPVVGVEGR
jgi:hypothetical protein